MNLVVAYMRFSSENQSEGMSIEYQRRRIREYARSHDMKICKEYIDEARTGTNDRRPAFRQMIAEARGSHEWNAVLVFDLSRFSRNSTDAVIYRDALEDNGVELISVTQEFDQSNEGRLMEHITIGLNEYYSRNNAKHTHAGMMEKAKQAKHCGGRPPLGYRTNAQGEYEIEPKTAIIVKEIFDLYELGYSYRRMAEILNAKGYQTGGGQPFNKNSFGSILTQQKNVGTYVWNKAREKSSKSTRNSHAQKPHEKQIVIPGAIPPIIASEQFCRVQQIMSSRACGVSGSKARYRYLFGGLKILKCANCGAYMIGNRVTSHGHVYRQYICPNHREHICPTKAIRADDLDLFAVDALVSNSFKGIDLDELATAVNSSVPNIRRMFQQRAEAKKAIAELKKAIAKGCDQALIDELKKRREEETRIEAQIQSARRGDDCFTSSSDRRSAQKKLRKYILSSDSPDVRAYLQESIKEITVSNNDVSISIQVS